MHFYSRVPLFAKAPDEGHDRATMPVSHPQHHHSHHKIRLIVACAVLFFLVAAHAILVSLWGSHALDKHLFSISKVSERTQAITIGAQATITVLLVLLSFVVQGVAADHIIRRRQTVAALQDSLDAWKGLGAALVALWRGRGLGARLRSRVLIVTAFFAAASVLQITTPSVITVNTANATTTTLLTVDTMPGNFIHLNFSQLTWKTDTSTKTIIGSLPLSWNQSLVGSPVGAPAGLNGSVFFSTLDTAQNETLLFHDPYAKQFTVGCASIPRHAGDLYNASFEGSAIGDPASGNDFNALSLTLQPVLSPMSGVDIGFVSTPSWEQEDDQFEIGGEKATKDSSIMFRLDDTVLYAPIDDRTISPTDFAITSFFFLSTRHDALDANATLGIEPPVVIEFKAEVWSWVQNNSLTETEAKNHSFLENGTFTVYAWPIGCTLYVQNITADVLGNNQMVRTTSNVATIDRTNLFNRPAPSSPLERSWEELVETIWFAEYGTGSSADSSQGESLPFEWLENLFLPLLNGTTLPNGGAKTPSIADRFAAMESTLERVSALAYGLVIQSFRSHAHDGLPEVASSWAAVNGTVTGQQSVIRGKFTINGLQVVIGCVCVMVLLLAVLFAVIVRGQDMEEMRSNVVRDGGVIDLISLVKGSSVPNILAGGSLLSTSAKHRREVAERTLIKFGHDRLDTPERIRDLPETSSEIPDQPAFPETSVDPMALTQKALQRIPYYTTEPPPDTRPWSSTLKPYYLAAQLVLLALIAFSIVFVVIWSTQLFDHHLWPVEKLGKISQITSTVAQLWSIGPLLVLAYVVQKIAADKSMRRLQTVADLHDSLGAWGGGLGASIGAVWRGARYMGRVSFDVIMVTLLFTVIAVLHITTPTVVTVDTVSRQVPVSAVALSTPGHLYDIGYSSDGPTSFAQILNSVLNTVPYLYESKNMTSVSLPPGLNDSVLYSSPYSALGSDVVFTDRNASQLNVHCGVVPYSEKYSGQGFTLSWTQPDEASLWNDTMLYINLPYGFDITPTIGWQGAINVNTLKGLNGDYVFGGPKANRDDPPTVKFNDVLAWSTASPNDTMYEYGTVGLSFISLRNDSLRLNSSTGFASPLVYKTNITNWAWVEDPSLTPEQQMAHAFNETALVTFYVYPLACSLYTTPITALVRGDGKLISTDAPSDLRNDSDATPFYRPLPVYDTELLWWNLTDGLYRLQLADVSTVNSGGGGVEFTWLELTLLDRVVNGTGIRSLEDSLTYMSTLAYTLLVQSYRAQFDAAGGGPDALKALAPSWVPVNVTLNGTQPQLFARLKVEARQLFITFACTILLFMVTIISTYGHASAHIDPVVRDGGVIDILSLMAESSLPAVIGESVKDEADGRDGRRVRAERTLVAYSIATLDVPDQLQQRVDGALLSSSSKEATQSPRPV